MNNFTDGKPRIVTSRDLEACWGDSPDNFRCGFCGHKFILGDYYRWQYTNDVPGAPGNPFVCKYCDVDPEILKKQWRVMHVNWKEMVNGKYWYFHKTMQNKP